MRSVECIGKATVANFSCGFDILGFSVNDPGDLVKLTKTDDFNGVVIKSIIGTDQLSYDPQKNTAGFAVLKYFEMFGIKDMGIEIELTKNMPLGSGMGSSAASAAAAIIGINKLFMEKASEKQLLEIGLSCEKLACGSAHADNIAPSLFGGITLIRDTRTKDFVKIPVPKGLYCMIIHPNIIINTKDSREILPNTLQLKTAVKQWGNIAALTSALYQADFQLLKRSIEDFVIEPYRSKLIPYFDEMRQIAMDNDLFNLSISGSGPSVFSLSDSEEKLHTAGKKIHQFLFNKGISSNNYISSLNETGSEVVNCEV
jgi:homoserine kinase